MAHKVHPKVFRIGETEGWNSTWFSSKKYKESLEEDLKVRDFLKRKFEKGVIEKVKITKLGNKINIEIATPSPGVLIGKGGEGIENLSRRIKNIVKGKEIKIDIEEVREPATSARLLAQQVASDLERRVPYRRAAKRAIGRALRGKGTKGIKVVVKGRLDGAEIARKETFREGEMPLQTIRADIDYGEARAQCTYGIVGVKIWLYKEKKD